MVMHHEHSTQPGPHARRAMGKALTVRRISLRIAPLALALGLALATTQAQAYYGGSHYGGRSYGGHSYGGHRYGGYRYGGYGGHRYGGYRYRGYGGHYGRSYGYYRPYAYGGRSGGYYRGGLLYGLLSIPGAVLGSVFGHRGGTYGGGTYDSGRFGSDPNGRTNYGGSTYDGGTGSGAATIPPANNSAAPGASRDTGSLAPYQGGWARLAEGHYSQALSIFGAEASSRPRDGGPKVGFALSAAGTGDLRRGVWAMRRALRIDPDSVHYLSIDGSLRPRVEHLVTQYQHNPGGTLHDAEAAFMLASLHYLMRDTAAARASFDAALASGEQSPSATNLGRLIDAEPASGTLQADAPDPASPPESGEPSPGDY